MPVTSYELSGLIHQQLCMVVQKSVYVSIVVVILVHKINF